MKRRLALAHLPTPLWHSAALDQIVGTEVWVKRDDMSSAAAAGNKIRKLEFLLVEAEDRRASVILTCGAVQSNHARATAILAAERRMRSLLFLRAHDPAAPQPVTGNLLIDRMVGASVRFISPREYDNRNEVMAAAARDLEKAGERPYVIPEGGSNGRGALGYVEAMREVRSQLDANLAGGPRVFDAVVHACGSGGTAAGVTLGAARYEVAANTLAMAVCGDRGYFEQVIERIVAEARAIDASLTTANRLTVDYAWKGPAYGVATEDQLRFIVEVATQTGLLLDPVYTGKALFGLSRLDPKPARVLFIHTGGLPGLLAQSADFAPVLA
jgi:D-cysteine desulfhydrase